MARLQRLVKHGRTMENRRHQSATLDQSHVGHMQPSFVGLQDVDEYANILWLATKTWRTG